LWNVYSDVIMIRLVPVLLLAAACVAVDDVYNDVKTYNKPGDCHKVRVLYTHT